MTEARAARGAKFAALQSPGLVLVVPALIAAWIAGSEFAHLRWLDREAPAQSLLYLQATQPWGGLAARDGARLLESRWRLERQDARSALEWQLGRYPLDPWRWLLFSRMAFSDGADESRLADLLATAISVQPRNREVRWQAANLAQSTGRADLVFRQLRLLLAVNPRATGQALFIGSRWSPDPARLLENVLPEGKPYLEQAMNHARRTGSMPLAEAVWHRLIEQHGPDAIAAGEPAFADYTYLALRQQPTRAMQAWAAVDPDYEPGQVPAGDFDYPVNVLPAFGWSLRMPKGANLERTSLANTTTKTPNALRVSFSGEHNLRLTTPAVRFPVARPGQYRLRGWWRAEDLTTRALPYLWLDTRSEDHRTRERVDVPAPDFGWTPFEIDFATHAPDQSVVFRLRRDSTDNFDRFIEGRVELAGLDTVRLLPSTRATSASSAFTRARDLLAGDCDPGAGDNEQATDCRETPSP
ncbi:hypothetical protein [Wenzhouxiangella sp. EGI_FJ10409]|uniref:hypothetical protein n=1 Tax=Wenzhouxiangella sp. EGI_FJ10409 TaxID=3243767 RepID=UPI0035E30B7F